MSGQLEIDRRPPPTRTVELVDTHDGIQGAAPCRWLEAGAETPDIRLGEPTAMLIDNGIANDTFLVEALGVGR